MLLVDPAAAGIPAVGWVPVSLGHSYPDLGGPRGRAAAWGILIVFLSGLCFWGVEGRLRVFGGFW